MKFITVIILLFSNLVFARSVNVAFEMSYIKHLSNPSDISNAFQQIQQNQQQQQALACDNIDTDSKHLHKSDKDASLIIQNQKSSLCNNE